jgi:hypothetical protein
MFKRLTVLIVSVNLFTAGLAHAGVIGTGTVIQHQEQQGNPQRLDQIALQESVATSLRELGVDLGHAKQRVKAMTNEELQQLENRLDQLPAASGALEVIGIVFLVLLILEVVGVTDIFKRV